MKPNQLNLSTRELITLSELIISAARSHKRAKDDVFYRCSCPDCGTSLSVFNKMEMTAIRSIARKLGVK